MSIKDSSIFNFKGNYILVIDVYIRRQIIMPFLLHDINIVLDYYHI